MATLIESAIEMRTCVDCEGRFATPKRRKHTRCLTCAQYEHMAIVDRHLDAIRAAVEAANKHRGIP